MGMGPWIVRLVVVAFVDFVIAAEIDPDKPSAIASCDDLLSFASHRDFAWLPKETHIPHTARS